MDPVYILPIALVEEPPGSFVDRMDHSDVVIRVKVAYQVRYQVCTKQFPGTFIPQVGGQFDEEDLLWCPEVMDHITYSWWYR